MRLTNFQIVRWALPGIVTGANMKAALLRLRVMASAVQHRHQLSALTQAESPALGRILREQPAVVVGVLVWPYICASWNASKRLDQMGQHYAIVDRLAPQFHFSVDKQLVLLNLSDIHPGLRVVLDQPPWFIREGGLTLNLFIDDFRAYSLAFSFSNGTNGGIDCLIGSLQGRSTEHALALYRDLTKTAHGLRPRDLLIEICRILCRHWQVQRLLGVRNNQRHHLHSYFGKRTLGPQDYDAIWEDRGGVCEDDCFYRLPLAADRRDDEDIKPGKRSLYRRRYNFLDRLDSELTASLNWDEPVKIPAE